MRKLAFALLVACTLTPLSAKVTTDANPSASFAAYRTYYWAQKPEVPNPLMQQRIIDGVDARLRAKGWTLDENGQVALAAHVSTAQQHSLDTFYNGGAMGGWGWRGWGGVGMGTASTTVRTYTTGTLVLDMFDAASKQAVWRGTISNTLSSNPDKVTSKLNKDLDKLFAKFPPGTAG